MTLVN